MSIPSEAPGVRLVQGVEWPAIFAGTVVAAGISTTLLAFGAAIGLSVTSTAPTWRDSSPVLWLLSGIYLLFVTLCAFGFGGYVAGRMRRTFRLGEVPEIEFGDGMHGIITWGTAIVLTALLALGAAAIAAPAAVPGGSRIGPATSVAGENIIASELDVFFRSARRTVDPDTLTYRRAEAARILLKSSSHQGVSGEDRDYLALLAMNTAGIDPTEASARADRAIADSRTELSRAREAAVLQAFMVAAALLLGAAVAWFSAAEGGRERENGWLPRWDWSWRRRTA
ncbi:MAG TPA: hypothetical protein VGG36_01895 [Rhizomicrobium sp.]|jgi:hypothetical protein